MNKAAIGVSVVAITAITWAGAVHYTGTEVDNYSAQLITSANQAMQGEALLVNTLSDSSFGKRSYLIELQDQSKNVIAQLEHNVIIGPGLSSGEFKVVDSQELYGFLAEIGLKKLPLNLDWKASVWSQTWDANFVVTEHDLSANPNFSEYKTQELRLVMNGDLNGNQITGNLVWPGLTIKSDQGDVNLKALSMSSVSSLVDGVYLNDDFSMKIENLDISGKNFAGEMAGGFSSKNLILASRGKMLDQQISGDLQLSSESFTASDVFNQLELSNTQLMLTFKDFSWQAFKLAQQNVEDIANPDEITKLIVEHGFEARIDKLESNVKATMQGQETQGLVSASGKLDLAGGPATVSDEELIPRIAAVVELKVDQNLVNHFAGPYAQQIPLLIGMGYLVEEAPYLKTKLEFVDGQLIANDAAPIPL
ncbi:DUF945 family protein [Alginatibacterium sediminis]|uniref:DUF945 family protein n=1 Tax=Alginatibacterium sediminis TaxID=2164068 RepID=A0A420EHJ3_9ALTE|nr:DUF945 family protein [Alginatibacterium sediminis]RKF20182.1 DUF945 family protein [Alginatibacterium sediminis]